MRDCLVNGEIARHVPADDRGLAYGDGLFETLVVSGGQPRFWQAHMDRMAEGCQRLELDMPRQSTLLREVQTAAAGQPRSVVKILLSRQASARGYAGGGVRAVQRVVIAFEHPADVDTPRRDGVPARSLELRLAVQPALGGIKHLNRLEQVLAARELQHSPGVEGILLDRDEHLVSAVSANLFLVSGGNLLTPRMDRCGVRGVVRALILRDFKPRCELRRVTADMLHEVDEAFVCNVVRGIVPLLRIDGHHWPIGPVTRELQDWFAARAERA